jgi:hypothetical protein
MFCKVSIVLTLTKNAAPNSDGFVTWTDQSNVALSTLTTTNILFNTATYVAAYIGVYDVTLTYTWPPGPQTLARTFTFTVIDPCIPTIVPPASIPNYTAYIGDPNFTQNIAPTVGVTYQAYCVYSISLAATKVPAPLTPAAYTYTNQVNVLYTDIPNSKVTYNASIQDLANAGVYSVTLTYTWAGSGAAQTLTRTFTLTLDDPCVNMVIPTFTSTTKTLVDPNTSFLVTPTVI